MLARCVKTRLSDLPRDSREHVQRYVHLDDAGLVVGGEYQVFGILFRDGQPWILICEEEADSYPTPQFGALFELVDARVPPGWDLRIGSRGCLDEFALLPTQWAKSPDFLELLVNDDPVALRTFAEIKADLLRWRTQRNEAEQRADFALG